MDTPAAVLNDTQVAAKTFPSSSGQMFGQYFANGNKWSFKKHDLLDSRARRIFETTAMGCAFDAYPFQMPLEGRSGPMVLADGHRMLLLSSYDYLGLNGHPRVERAAIEALEKYGTSTGGARLLTGTLDLHYEAERAIAEYKRTEAAVTYSSGYMANVGVISALFGPADRVIMDELCHRSLLDACKMAGVQVQRFKHNDMDSLRHEIRNGFEANRTLLISDGVFSMDGDICLLPDLIEVKKEFGCFLLMDEAHATGTIGATGRGTDEYFGIDGSDVDIWTGSLAKSIPSNGGFVACSQQVAIYLQHASSPYIFSGAMNASAVAAITEAFAVLRDEPERVACVQKNATFLREGLQQLGYDTGLSETPVIPVVLKDETATAMMARRLRDHGVLAAPVMFPAVAQGAARLRLCVTAAHTREHLQFALDAFSRLATN